MRNSCRFRDPCRTAHACAPAGSRRGRSTTADAAQHAQQSRWRRSTRRRRHVAGSSSSMAHATLGMFSKVLPPMRHTGWEGTRSLTCSPQPRRSIVNHPIQGPGAIVSTEDLKPLWRCPACGRPFTRKGHSHSCARHTVDEHLSGKSEAVRRLYRAFERLVLSLCDAHVTAAKTRIGFQNRRIFACVNRIAASHIDAHIVTSAPIASKRIRRVEVLDDHCFVNHLRIASERELDEQLARWLRRGVAWGEAASRARSGSF